MSALGAPEFTQLIASTLEKMEPQLIDNIFTEQPSLELLKKHATSYTGRSLVLNLELGESEDTVVTDESGTFATDVSADFIGSAEFDWSRPYVSKTRQKWQTLQMNQGKEALVNLAEAHINNMVKSHQKRLVQGLFKPAEDVGSGEFNSLDMLVSDAEYDAAEGFMVGKIPTWESGSPNTPDNDSPWQATRLTIPVDGETGGQTIRKAFRTMRNELMVNTLGDAKITHVIAGRLVFEELEDSFDEKVRYVDFSEGQTRFRAIYDGDIEVRLDPDCPEDRAYFLDVSSLRFGYLNGNLMKVQEAQFIPGTLDFITPAASVLALGTNERRRNGLLIRTGGVYDD